MSWLKNTICSLTIEQWLIIDDDYIEPEFKSNQKCISTIILITLILVIQKYFGQSKHFTQAFGQFVVNMPLSGLYPRLYMTFMCLILYMLIPFIFIRIVLKGKICDYGFTLRGFSRYIPMYLIMFGVMLPILIGVSFSERFYNHYPLYYGAGESFLSLSIWEISYGLYFLALEFFLRGFMVFALARYIGSYAIFVMVIPYVMIHFGKPFAETVGSIIAGIALGTLSLRTRSIFGGVFIHIAIAWGMDILALLQKGQLQSLFFR
jgi:hypothetical protein